MVTVIQHNSMGRQSGAALLVALIILLVLTLLGLTSSQVGVLQERMAGNVQDSNLAFQRAEETLRDIERRLRELAEGRSGGLGVIPTWAGLGLQVGDCTLSQAHPNWNTAPWRSSPTAGHNTEFLVIDLGNLEINGIPTPSGCAPMSEQADPLGQFYLIAARARGQVATTESIVQSIFFWP